MVSTKVGLPAQTAGREERRVDLQEQTEDVRHSVKNTQRGTRQRSNSVSGSTVKSISKHKHTHTGKQITSPN